MTRSYWLAAGLALVWTTAAAGQPMDHSAHAAHAAGPETGSHSGDVRHPKAHGAAGALGSYPMTREASGTSWQPDVSEHGGVHATRDGWMLMGHATINGVYDWQDGPRGDEKAFVSGMVMGSARRDLGARDTLTLRAMFSPDPLMGKRGYPLLLAAGETADGRTPLVDRQHPHELVMELSASVSHRLSDQDSVFLYAGLPGEPAFGPPAFMHRLSAMDSPEAPITHHWLDSTHIVFGVVTAGYVHGGWKVEASAFKGREPDQDRYDIEAPKLDSAALRLSWNPVSRLALQASWADQASPEALDDHHDVERWSASAIYTVPTEGGWWSTTLAWGRKTRSGGGKAQDAIALESAYKRGPWTLFGRAEHAETDELTGGHGASATVAKASLGAVRDFRLREDVSLGLGGLYTVNRLPDSLEGAYGGDPGGAMAFVRLKIGG